jgi:hypothetical protein
MLYDTLGPLQRVRGKHLGLSSSVFSAPCASIKEKKKERGEKERNKEKRERER